MKPPGTLVDLKIEKIVWKGELIQFELRESISTQTNAHH